MLATYVAVTNVFWDQTAMIDIAPSTTIVQSVKAVVVVSARMAITVLDSLVLYTLTVAMVDHSSTVVTEYVHMIHVTPVTMQLTMALP